MQASIHCLGGVQNRWGVPAPLSAAWPAVDAGEHAKGRALAARGLARQGAPPDGPSAHADRGRFRRLQDAAAVKLELESESGSKMNLSMIGWR